MREIGIENRPTLRGIYSAAFPEALPVLLVILSALRLESHDAIRDIAPDGPRTNIWERMYMYNIINNHSLHTCLVLLLSVDVPQGRQLFSSARWHTFESSLRTIRAKAVQSTGSSRSSQLPSTLLTTLYGSRYESTAAYYYCMTTKRLQAGNQLAQ